MATENLFPSHSHAYSHSCILSLEIHSSDSILGFTQTTFDWMKLCKCFALGLPLQYHNHIPVSLAAHFIIEPSPALVPSTPQFPLPHVTALSCLHTQCLHVSRNVQRCTTEQRVPPTQWPSWYFTASSNTTPKYTLNDSLACVQGIMPTSHVTW